MTLQVCLVGGQPLPNLLPIRHYAPDTVLLAYTSTTQSVFARLAATLAPISVRSVECDAYNIQSIIEQLRIALQGSDPNQTTFNITGGTKAMAIGAYSLAAEMDARFLYLESEKRKSRVYHYQFRKGIPIFLFSELIPSIIFTEDFLNVHLGKGQWSAEGYSRTEGGPFEQAIGSALQQNQFQIKAGVKSHDGQTDIDIVVGMDNQFGIIQAKAGASGTKLDGIKQLSTNARFLGTYTRQFYAIDQTPNEAHNAIVAASQIKVLSLTSFRTDKQLSEQDQETLVNQVRGELIGA